MDNSIFRLSLDIHRQTTQAHLSVMKGDTARKIVISLTDGGKPYRITEGCAAVFSGKKPDGNVLFNSCSIENNCIVYEFTEQTASCAGYMPCEIRLYGADNMVITSPRIAIIVSGLVYDDSEVESSSEFTALSQAMTDMAELKKKFDEAPEAIKEYLNQVVPDIDKRLDLTECFYVNVLKRDDSMWSVDKDYATIDQEHREGRDVVCCVETGDQRRLELPLVGFKAGSACFSAVCDGEEWQVEVSGMGDQKNVMVTTALRGKPALDVQISSDGDSSDATYAEIVAAHNAGRSVSCHFQDYVLPLMIAAPSAVIFQSIVNRNFVRVLITPDGTVRYSSGQYALMTDLDAKQDKAPATDAKYFGITDDGVVYLQPEYRGASTSSSMTLAMSDKGKGVAGSKNGELPEEIIIPEIVNEIAVTAYADGMFFCNNRIKRLVLLPSVKVIPKQFCAKCLNLEDVSGTENVEVLGNATFAYSTLGKASFPSLKTLDGTSHFGYCAKLVVADIGNVVTKIPDSLFVGCERLSCLRNAEKVTVVGANSFAFTHRLKTLPFLPNLTSIGAGGIFISRVAYDWGSLTGCAFGAKSTPKDINTTDFWTGRTFEACNTPMRSTFEQHDPRWADEEINGTLTASGSVAKFKEGCNLVSAAMAYSALAGVDMDSPAEFTEMAHGIDASLRTMEYDEMATTKAYLEAMGCTVTHRADYNAATLQEMYDALADGALVISSVLADASSGSTGHVVVFHGINEGGELLVVDPSSPARNIGIYEAITYPMPVQNRVRAVDDFLIVRKEV